MSFAPFIDCTTFNVASFYLVGLCPTNYFFWLRPWIMEESISLVELILTEVIVALYESENMSSCVGALICSCGLWNMRYAAARIDLFMWL